MIGILGGTFDPIHFGHLRTALDVKLALNLDEIRLTPLRHAVHRDQPETPAKLRLQMIEAAISGTPGFKTDDRELRRDSASYTIDTLLSLREELGEEEPLCLLMGSDAFKDFLSWHRPLDIATLAHLIIMTRPGQPAKIDPLLQQFLAPQQATDPAELRTTPGGRILFQTVTQLDISATHIRAMVANGDSPRFLLPDAVLEIIEQEKLYR
ncbi:MAG: nicotinate-nucleotide adenylyltransferase [Gammaproteobacteria bacterium (ex Lamellibrachia satsuma)]|nr:MAG: nicotinate-nucleotide adenylyltransferase [Gammaproteobacteria bacterium (ex Lamellibrachia satsuma)]RRS35368.1 MAG: nicotinate-nucleotide adenylyltransferase [Gammaproteobacteria bacterium (ex Lamellibrachia satsuma)]RRS36403.1 MAG: nicotinate-nucleotide adenylyltransferase [Gammaproteobacteria bacterium (ex Lamellibrachia satsuma)]